MLLIFEKKGHLRYTCVFCNEYISLKWLNPKTAFTFVVYDQCIPLKHSPGQRRHGLVRSVVRKGKAASCEWKIGRKIKRVRKASLWDAVHVYLVFLDPCSDLVKRERTLQASSSQTVALRTCYTESHHAIRWMCLFFYFICKLQSDWSSRESADQSSDSFFKRGKDIVYKMLTGQYSQLNRQRLNLHMWISKIINTWRTRKGKIKKKK